MQASVPSSEKEFLDLVDAALGGEEVIITPNDRSAVKLVPVERKQFKLGILDGVLTADGMPNFFEPMDEEDLRLWEGRE